MKKKGLKNKNISISTLLTLYVLFGIIFILIVIGTDVSKYRVNDLFDIINKQNENNIKKNNQNPFDYNKIMINFVEYLTKKIENNSETQEKVDNSNENRKIKSYKSNPSLLELKAVEIMTKENGVSFEYPINKKRSLSLKIEERLKGSSKSSEEISRHIKEKMDTAEKNREIIWKNQADSSNKINEKISEIRYKQKEEKKRKLNQIYTKLAKMGEKQKDKGLDYSLNSGEYSKCDTNGDSFRFFLDNECDDKNIENIKLKEEEEENEALEKFIECFNNTSQDINLNSSFEDFSSNNKEEVPNHEKI